jgi:hypothetical protein
MTTHEVAAQLVALCREGKNLEAIQSPNANNVVSVEAMAMGGQPRETAGKAAVHAKNVWWLGAHEVHSATVEGPFASVEKFAVVLDYEVTVKASGERIKMKEVGVYTVDGGKITHEEFLYAAQ